MKYHLSLPEGWTAGRTWPVVVVIPDAARDFEANLAAFVKARGALPFILVAPHVVTSGGANPRAADTYRYSEADWKRVAADGDFRFDDEGIAAVLADVRRAFNAEERFFLTGWEAGGHTVWALTFRHPERLRASAPVSTNFLGRWLDEGAFSRSPERASLPVKVLFCGKSAAPKGWDFFMSQSKNALAAGEAHGFRGITFAEVPGRPHGPLADEVLAFFEAVRRAGSRASR
jgi:poly(3-hydroxybutyrate) depolymerase